MNFYIEVVLTQGSMQRFLYETLTDAEVELAKLEPKIGNGQGFSYRQ